jgi:hypothetical protein
MPVVRVLTDDRAFTIANLSQDCSGQFRRGGQASDDTSSFSVET